MSEIIQSEIEDARVSVPVLSDLSDEYIFSLVCYKYFYNDGRLDRKDYFTCFADGKNDGGIDIVTTDEANEQVRFILIQGKMITEISNKQDFVDIFTKMNQTVRDFEELRTSQYNKKLKRIYKENLDSIIDKGPVFSLVLFTAAKPSKEQREKIQEKVDTTDELKNYEISIFYKDDIEEQIGNIKEPKQFVREGQIKISNEAGMIRYGDSGILVNISGLSLRDLYDKYRESGLFEQNFRYFIRNKRIDDNIKESLKNKRDIFWFMNNGIIIACEDFWPDGDNVKLFNFSIINGCQTATLIGEYKGKNEAVDFVLPCKIVKPPEGKVYEQFVSDIAESSNSQKPISDRDLKSNRVEQRSLQRQLMKSKPEIYLWIKRGEKLLPPAKKKQLHDWQCLTNELFGQIILSFHLQQPGTARNSTRTIFSSPSTYENIFVKRKYDELNIIELLKLNQYYTDFLNRKDFGDVAEESVGVNGRFIMLAIVGFMIKEKRGIIDAKRIASAEEWEREISKDEITGRLFVENLPDDFEAILDSLFYGIVAEIADFYKTREGEEKSVSNFFKSDQKYRDVILKRIVSRYYNTPMKKKELDRYLELFSS